MGELAQVPAQFPTAPLSQIRPSPTQPRKLFRQERLEEIAASIREHGVIQPILVRPHPDGQGLELVCGETRWRSSKLAGKTDIPVIVRDLDNRTVHKLQLLENIQRNDLTPLEEADAFDQHIKIYRVTAEELAAELGKSKSYVVGRMALCSLGEKGRALLESGVLGKAQAMMLARVSSAQARTEIEEQLAKLGAKLAEGGKIGEWDFRESMENALRDLEQPPFNPKDAKLYPEAGACGPCAKRSGAQTQLDLAGIEKLEGNHCTDKDCFEEKAKRHWAIVKAKAEKKGLPIVEGKAAEKALSYGGGFVRLSEQAWQDDQRRTYSELLKKEIEKGTVEVTLVQGGIGGHEVVRKEQLAEVLKGNKSAWAQQFTRTSSSGSSADFQKEQELKLAKGKRAGIVAEKAKALIIEKVLKKGAGDKAALELIFLVLTDGYRGGDVLAAVAKYFGVEGKSASALQMDLRAMVKEGKVELLSLSLVAAVAWLQTHNSYGGAFDEDFVALASSFKVDVKELLKAEIAAEKAAAKAKAAAEKKPAASSAKGAKKAPKGKVAAKSADVGPDVAEKLKAVLADTVRCAVPECIRDGVARGLCASHYRKARRLGFKDGTFSAEQLAQLADPDSARPVAPPPALPGPTAPAPKKTAYKWAAAHGEVYFEKNEGDWAPDPAEDWSWWVDSDDFAPGSRKTKPLIKRYGYETTEELALAAAVAAAAEIEALRGPSKSKTAKPAKSKPSAESETQPAAEGNPLGVRVACVGCGCTEDNACEGGCYWQPDATIDGKRVALCNKCKGIDDLADPAFLTPTVKCKLPGCKKHSAAAGVCAAHWHAARAKDLGGAEIAALTGGELFGLVGVKP